MLGLGIGAFEAGFTTLGAVSIPGVIWVQLVPPGVSGGLSAGAIKGCQHQRGHWYVCISVGASGALPMASGSLMPTGATFRYYLLRHSHYIIGTVFLCSEFSVGLKLL